MLVWTIGTICSLISRITEIRCTNWWIAFDCSKIFTGFQVPKSMLNWVKSSKNYYFASKNKFKNLITHFVDMSPEPVIILVDVQSTSIHHKAPICPFNVPKRSPFTENHTFGLLSLPHDRIKSPSRLYLICVIARSCPCKTIGFCQNGKKK